MYVSVGRVRTSKYTTAYTFYTLYIPSTEYQRLLQSTHHCPFRRYNIPFAEFATESKLNGGKSWTDLNQARRANKLTADFPEKCPKLLLQQLGHDHAGNFLANQHVVDLHLAKRIVGGFEIKLDEANPGGDNRLNVIFDRKIFVAPVKEPYKAGPEVLCPFGGFYYANSRVADKIASNLYWAGEEGSKPWLNMVVPQGKQPLEFIRERLSDVHAERNEWYQRELIGTKGFGQLINVVQDDGTEKALVVRVLWEPAFDEEQDGYALEQWRARTKEAAASLI